MSDEQMASVGRVDGHEIAAMSGNRLRLTPWGLDGPEKSLGRTTPEFCRLWTLGDAMRMRVQAREFSVPGPGPSGRYQLEMWADLGTMGLGFGPDSIGYVVLPTLSEVVVEAGPGPGMVEVTASLGGGMMIKRWAGERPQMAAGEPPPWWAEWRS